MKAVLWTRFRDDRYRQWSVWISRPDITPELESNYGVCIPDQRRIYINANMPKRTYAETLLHELLHASVVDVGISREEQAVSLFSVHLLPILKQFAFTLPRPPRLPWARQRKKDA